MNTLYPGMQNRDVERWQLFLRGLSQSSQVVVTGEYDVVTLDETKKFQKSKGLDPDGVVGPQTLSHAIKMGLDVIADNAAGDDGPNWPAQPEQGPLSLSQRMKTFGKFSFEPSPSPNNPEGIRITDDWAAKNITTVVVPQLVGVKGASKTGSVQVHQAVSGQLLKVFSDWQAAGLSDRILSWGGSWVPRFIRGSRTSLSNHAWGTAFDVNVPWNGLGIRPPLRSQKGSVRDLVDIAYQNGFYWGGWFKGRPDGMHFEAYKILT